MEDIVAQVAEKLGIDPGQASEIVSKLQSGGLDIGALLQSGDLAEKAKGLLSGDLPGLAAGIPGVGDLLGNLAPKTDSE